LSATRIYDKKYGFPFKSLKLILGFHGKSMAKLNKDEHYLFPLISYNFYIYLPYFLPGAIKMGHSLCVRV